MDRRKAMGLIAAAAAGIAIIPSCKPGATTAFKTLKINPSQVDSLEALSYKILPIPQEMALKNISPTDFMLTMLDDCRSPEDQEKFMSGLNHFEEHLKTKALNSVDALNLNALKDLLESPEERENAKSITYFLKEVKRYNVQYYTTMEAYLNTYTDWEFAPGRFDGCASI